MTLQEVGKIIYTIKAVYPQSFIRYSQADYENMTKAWASVFSDYSCSVVSAGLSVYLASDTKGFPPSPGQIIDCITKITRSSDTELTAMEAWSCVLRAARNSNYHATEEFDNLPTLCQRAIGSPDLLRELGQMDSSVVNTVEQSNFMRVYEAMLRRTCEEEKIPNSVRELMSKTVERLEINGEKRVEAV